LLTSAKDQVQTATGRSATPSSGNTPAATAQPNELLIGAIGYADRTQAVTAGTGFTSLASAANGGGASANGVLIQPEYRIVSASAQYAATGSANVNKGLDWAAAIVTYKETTPIVSSITRADSTPTKA